jgi:predicted lipoprotein with Yx(FWY)xxD motif
MHRARITTGLAAATGLLGIGLLAACNVGSYGQAQPGAPASTSPSASAQANGQPNGPGTAATSSLSTSDIANLGTVVTDQDGRTLYLFTNDSRDPSSSSCSGACAQKWPPAVVGQDKVRVSGIDTALLGTTTRPDGSKQITLNGSPLYRFSGDAKAGDANGENVGGTWFAVTARGDKATTQGSNDSNSNSNDGNSNSY